jgi:hypothetical protein
VLLAMHRMPAYRARAFSLVASLAPGALAGGKRGGDVCLSESLAPPFRPSSAHAVLPPPAAPQVCWPSQIGWARSYLARTTGNSDPVWQLLRRCVGLYC